MADDEQRVRQLAYRIWESEGRPEGQAQRHWDMAWKIVAAERAARHEAELDALDAPHDEAPILEEDLPLEEDEIGIQENRLPLDDPEDAPGFEESPYRDDFAADEPAEEVSVDDVPVHDRATGAPAPAPDTPATPKTVDVKKTPAKAASKAAAKTGEKTGTSKAGTSARKSPATQKTTQKTTQKAQAETTKPEPSKKRMRSSLRDKTPKPGET
ncbi:DUF2934 domain-containing protein [Halomonas sp. TRM85114]|uniref:DUF2934 domain-containing protein n=1 Tax=Halomonas jincaotanensis TaxID=2810616 RepID=UPI001BD2432D|nr:DUF2934 domain-containing protein [Halomonas jincaotanensis]MBS9402797.1 DUF2934 domain-containing protein [Halomonas jincaotanensis]